MKTSSSQRRDTDGFSGRYQVAGNRFGWLCGVTLCWSIASIPPSAVAESRELFDGRTLRGWEGEIGKVWTVEEGTIVAGSVTRKQSRNEFLSTKSQFEDFDLRLEFRISGHENINAGVQFRTARIPNHHEVVGYQADIGPGYDGSLYDESRRRVTLAKPDKETLSKVEKAAREDGWQTYRIRAIGPRIELWRNGVKTVDYVEKSKSIDRRGVVALQIHGGMKGKIAYRKIVIDVVKP